MGVHDVGTEPPEQADEFAESQDVVGDRDRSGGVRDRFVMDPPGVEVGDPRAGGRRGDDVHTCVGECTELRPEQKGQAHVGRRDMDHALFR